MSAKLMGAVFYLDLPKPEKCLLLALADHAENDGASVWPGNERLARKTSDSVRNVQRLLRSLERGGLIARVANAAGGKGLAVEWAINAPLIYELAAADGGAGTRETVSAAPGIHDGDPAKGDMTAPNHDMAVPKADMTAPNHDITEPNRDVADPKGDMTARERVTSPHRKGDSGVTPTIREPSREPSREEPPLPPQPVPGAAIDRPSRDRTPARTRPRDLVFEAVAAVCFGADDWSRLTSRERGMANRACKELRAVNATPTDVAERAAHFVAWVGQRPTPDNLVTHWNRLREPVQKLHRDDLDAFADAERMRRIVADGEAAERQRAAEAASASTVTADRRLESGYPPPTSPSAQHPRMEGESVRDYIRRINALSREVG